MNRPAIWPEVRPSTLAGLLRARAAERPDRVAFTFLADGEEESARLTYAGLDRQARTIAASLRETLVPGDRALLLFPPGLEFIAAFFGCLYAGVIAVPAYPPRSNDRSQSRLRSIVRDAEPKAALTTSSILAGLEGAGGLLARAAELAPELALLRWLPTDALELYGSDTGEISLGALRDPDRFRADRGYAAEPDPDSVAFLQYTSGSTAAPKGVMVTHANLLHNERMIGQAFAQDEDTVVVGWLPLYHDMGLIGNVLQPLHAGARCVLMSPVAFLQKPLRWLEAISRYRGTTSGGPNFAYELCLRRISPDERARLDLYSWKVAFNGAEPVREATLERFAEAFAGAGFRKEAFYPCYGLAEATLLVTGGTVGRAPRVEAVDAAALERHEVRPADPDAPEGAGVRRLVGCGHAWLDQRVLVADPETGHECPPDRVGEIWVAGPSVARGYWRNPDATERDFGAFLSNGDGPFLRTGDLGFQAGGEVYVTGRIKDLIIVRGRNHYPQDLELTAERSHPDLHPGGGAAFSVDVNGEERLVIVHEVERRRREGGAGVPAAEIGEAVRRAVAEEHEVQVHEVVLIRSGTLPKTSSGKVQRHAVRSGYLAGNLLMVGRSALAEAAGPAAPALDLSDLSRDALGALPAGERAALVEAYLRGRAAALIGVPAEQIDPDQPLTGFGLDSLAAVELKGAVEAALGAPVSLADLLQGADLRSLAAQVLAGLEAGRDGDETEVPRLEPLPAAARTMDQALSFGQKSLWFLDRLAPDGGAYNIVAAARTRSELDAAALGRALARLTARHEAFRTVFHTVEGLGDEPVQRVLAVEDAPPVDLIVEDASGWSDRELDARLEAEAWRPFSLERGPLLRVRVWESPGERTVLLAVHHIVADFWSLAVVARELSALYREETGGPAADLAPLPVSYLDFERWQGEILAGPRGERLWDYWRERLGGSASLNKTSLPDLDLPTDRPRPPVQTYRGAARAALFPAGLADRLRTLAASRGATLYMALLAAFQAQLGRAARQDDLAVGSPTAGRGAPELSGVVGYFVNPVVLRADLSGDPSFAELIDRARATALGALEHADYPFALLAERLRPARDPARSPLFQAMLVLQSGRPQDDPGLAAFALGEEGARIELGGLVLDSAALTERRSAFDLSLRLAETAEGALLASLEINADLFDGTTAARMLEQLRTFLEEAVADPGRPLAALPFLTAPERQAAVHEWNDTRGARPVRPDDDACLHELVEAQAARTPENTALVWEEGNLTYAELLERSRGLARHLRKLGVGPESVVGLFAERSPELVVGILGVLQAGAAYLPLDPAYPRERLAYMLEDSGARLLLTQKRLRDEIPGRPGAVLFLEDVEPGAGPWRSPSVSPDQLAYVIYTSGSTGRPKGVAVPHRGVVNRLLEAHERFGITAADSILQRASIGFDASVWEFLSPLVAGGRVVLAKPGGHQDLAYMVRTLAERKVSIVHFVPSILEVLVAEPGLERCAGSLRLMIAGGEALSGALRDRFAALLPDTLLANVYGPTEASIDLLWHFCTPEERGTPAATVPIGRPISNATAYVLDGGGLRPAAVGVPGELYLGGVALVRGYLGRPDLTAERFVPHPFGNAGDRLYRTGDLARFLPNGELEFLGRVDQQVKIRGVRIELGEIEAVLSRHPGIREAAVTVHDDPSLGRRLVAHAVPVVEGDGDPRELRRFLAAELPDAMVPAAYVFHAGLPRTGSGKLDRRALAALAPAEDRQPGVFTAPRTPAEEQIAAVFRDLLGAERVGIDDDFFELGGHSLLATRVLSRISRLFGVDLPVSALFQAPTVAALAERVIAAGRTPPAPPILPAPRDRALPLSFAQRRLWFLDRLEPGTATYNLPGDVRLAGPLDVATLAAALAAVERRHEALRTVFRAEETGPVQEIRPAAPAFLPLVDLAGLPAAAREPEAARLADAEAVRPFDLAAGPLWRSTLLRLDTEDHWLLLTLHHIVADGWSLGLFLRELAAVYGAGGTALPAALPAIPVQYADYAVWQHGFLRGEVLDRQLRYWRRRLTGVPVLELPADRPRPAVRTGRGATRSLRLPATVPSAVERLARETGATPFMVLLAAFDALLGRITAEETVAVGTPVANRQQVEVEPLIGFFVNSLVLQARVGDDPRFADLLARVREDALGAFAHQDLPFERLVEELRPERGLSLNPLFQVMFVLEDPLTALETGSLRLEPRRVETGTAKFDLTLTVATGAGWIATAELDVDLFDAERIQRLLGHWGNLLEGALAAPAARLSDLPLLSEAERQQLLVAWNTPERFPVDEAETLHGRFARQAAGHAETVALVAGNDRLTYADLDAASNRLARHLRSLGVRPGELVGLCLERSADMVTSILAILKAGGAYVPLDPGYPRERHAFVLEDARIHVLVTRDDLLAALPDEHGARVVCLDQEGDAIAALSGEPVESAAGASDIAYVIYTSGSTGRPKGVAVSHASVLRLFTATDALFGFGDGDVWTLFHSYAFDFSVWEIWGALLHGGRLVVVPFWVSRSPEAFYALLADEQVTVLNQTPSAFRQLVALEGTDGAAGREADLALRWVVFGGEALEPAGLASWLERHPERPRLANMYGITETTVHVTFREITAADAAGPVAGRSPIGRPVADLELYVLDRARNPAPAGVPGELYVGGPGLAAGYLDRPELTADRFVPNPWAALRGEPGARLYRSGDLARFLSDGDVEYLGRIDHQVKVRGFRIELGEIEAALARHPEVLESAVVARPETGGGRGSRLVGFAVPRQPGILTTDDLRTWIGRSLPDYMVPSSLVLLEALPITPSGKVDRRALALLEPAATIERAAYEAPRNPAEERLAEIWAEVLGLDRVGIHDDFFALGGHSLLATQLMARVRSVFAAEPPLRDLFEAPTPAAFAERLAGHVELEGIGSRVPLVPLPPGRAEAGVPLSFAQQRLWFLHELEPESAAYHIPGTLSLTGPLRPAALAWSLGEIVRRHATLRTVFASPGGAPVQIVRPAVELGLGLELPQADLAALPEEARRAEAARLERELSEKPFDLTAGPLMRTLLLRLGAEEHRLAVVMHHIVSDGWSLGVMVRELGVLYEAALRGESAGLPELGIQYPDFSVWQRRWLDGPVLDELLSYWRGRLAGELPLLDLPADRPRPAVRSGKGGLRPVHFSEQRTAGLRAVARCGGATLFMTLLAAFQTLIHRYTGQRDVLVGSPVANREALETEALIGCFINTLVLRGRPAPDRPFAALLAELRDETLGAYDHQSLPFERLVEELAPGRDRSRNPLFEVLLVLQNAPMPPLQLRDLRLALEEIDGGTTKLDLTLRLEERGAALAGMLEYDADLFEAATADRILGHLDTLLAGIAEDSGRPLEALPLLTVAERLELAAWNDTASAASAAAGACLHELVAARVQRSPDSEAVVADVDGRTVRWTAAELNAQANRLAHRLRALGIRPEERVGVCLRRTPSLIAALLGVLKAGGVYVPLDPAYPQERLAFMLADSGARVVLTEEILAGRLSFFTGRTVRLDADAAEIAQFRDGDPALLPGGHATPDNLAYLIYTSGSTGRPKGVAIEHRSAAVMVRWAAEVFPPEDLAGALASTSVCFDLSVFEIFVPLAAGGRVILADNALALPSLSVASEVTLINTVPSAIAELVRSGGLPPSVRTVNLAGEPLKAALVEQIYAGSRAERVLNLYGPSEDTTYSTYALVPRGTAAVPIGVPLAGSRVHLFASSWAEPAPAGVPGELCLAGQGLARGYLGRPDLTAERFVPDPFGQAGERLYRTGDLARWRDDGQLDFLGRLDHQVKVRGFRIELGEIEEVLAHHPAVKEVVVVAREDLSVGKSLVAYVVPRESWVLEAWGLGACDLGEGEGTASAPVANGNGRHEPDLAITLRGFLKTRLPEYMVPSFFVELPELPLTPNGKVDRKALPLPGTAGGGAEKVAPRSPVEELVAGLWAQVLGLPEDAEIGVFDSFFDLGGHSLLATQLVSRLREAFEIELPLARLFETPTVAGLARRVEEARAAAAGTAPPMRRVPHPLGQPLPLSFAQERLWFLDRMQPGAAYNLPLAVHLVGALDPARLSAVFEEIVRRHEALRTTFPEHDGDPVQVIGPPFAWELPLVDLTGISRAYGRALALAREEALRPFDLTRGPLLRTTLIRLAPEDHLLAFNMHHIVSDGWSLGVLLEEVAALYGASLAGEPSPLPELPVQYADFALWQRQWLRGEELERQMGFWRRQLEGATALLELPTDRPRPQVQTSHGAWQPVSLPAELVRDLGFGRRQGVTLFMVLLAAWQTLLFRYTGQRDLSVGSPIAGRNRGETERLIGFFVNTLVMRGDLSGNPTFEELLARVRRVALAAYAHQDLPFEKLVEELKPVRDMSHQPLFQVMLTLQNAPLGKMALPGLSLTPVEVGSSGSKFDLTLVLTEETDGVHGQLEYNTDLFDASTAARLAGHFRILLEGIAESPRQTVSAVPLLTGAERHQLLAEWSEARPEPLGTRIHDLLEHQAAVRPQAVACVYEQASWTFGELNRRANRLAGYLRGRGIGLESRVGLYVERDLDMLAAMFGVLKAGAAYLPFDSAYLGERLAFALQDAEVRILLTQERMLPKLAALDLPGIEIVRLDADWAAIEAGGADENPGFPVDDLNAAYVIYTSGSTGTPKGVTVPHRGVVAYIEASADIFQVTPEDTNLQFSSISFDASVEEIYTCLARGATLVVRGETQEGVSEFLRRIESYGITVMQVPTAYFHQMAAAMETEGLPFPPKLRRLIAGGERILPQRLVSWWKKAPERLVFVNGYGPTETTVAVTMCCFPGPVPIDERLNEVPLGYPLRYVHAYVVDRWMQPVPVGVSGELLIGGISLARGYLRRPDLTADRFIPNPFGPVEGEAGDRLYRTGDLVRFLPNGMLEFLGRLDDQVKVRGFRIELGEIEAVLSRHAGVREAVVLARDDGSGDKRLVAYVSTKGEPGPTVAELREFLERHLPAYMVPSALLVLPALPVNVHGKVDRKALPDPRVVQAPRAEYVAPAGELEEKIAEAWRELFGLEQVGVHDNFFDSGGNSLLIVKLHSRLQKVLGREFPLVEIFQHPTISALAASLGAGAAGEAPKPSVAVQARARTDTRRESMRQLQERRGQRRNQRNER